MHILTNAADVGSDANALRELTVCELGAVAGGGPGPKEKARSEKGDGFIAGSVDKMEARAKKQCEEDGDKNACWFPKWLSV